MGMSFSRLIKKRRKVDKNVKMRQVGEGEFTIDLKASHDI